MNLRQQLIAVADVYQSGRDISESYLSKQLFGNTKTLGEVRNSGGDVYTATWERAISYMNLHWPTGVVWPRGVNRP